MRIQKLKYKIILRTKAKKINLMKIETKITQHEDFLYFMDIEELEELVKQSKKSKEIKSFRACSKKVKNKDNLI